MSATASLEPVDAAGGVVKEEPLYEIVNGVKLELPPMRIYASWLSTRIAFRLEALAEPARLGNVETEALFILDPIKDIRRRPDVAFVSADKWPLDRPLPETGDWQLVPDLAVEVVSPNDVFQEVLAKMREYLRLGVRQVWIVLPVDREIYVYDAPRNPRVLSVDDELDGGTLLPGLRLPVASLFQRQPQAAPAE